MYAKRFDGLATASAGCAWSLHPDIAAISPVTEGAAEAFHGMNPQVVAGMLQKRLWKSLHAGEHGCEVTRYATVNPRIGFEGDLSDLEGKSLCHGGVFRRARSGKEGVAKRSLIGLPPAVVALVHRHGHQEKKCKDPTRKGKTFIAKRVCAFRAHAPFSVLWHRAQFRYTRKNELPVRPAEP